MYSYKKLGFLIALISSSFQAIAALDPIGQSLTPAQFPNTVKIGDSLSATYTLTNNKKNPVKVTITNTSVGHDIVTHDQCNGKTLAKRGAPGSQCTINISIDPTTTGPLNWKGVMHYDFNEVPLREITTTVKTQTQQVVANTDIDLPAETLLNHTPPYPFTFRFTNTGTTSVTGNGAVTANVSTFHVITNGCLNKTLAVKGDFCLISGTFTPAALGHVRVQGAFAYDSGKSIASVATETIVKAASGRVIATTEIPLPNPTYVNQGPYGFTFKFTNTGSAPVTGNGVFNAHGAPTTIANHCINKTLTQGQFCTMTGTFSPTSTGNVTLNGDFIYDGGALTASTATETTVNSSGGIIAQVTTALPPNVQASPTTYPFAFRFTNTSGTDLANSQQLSLPNTTGITNTCTSPFPHTSPGNVCTISGTFTSSGSSSVQTLSATITPTNVGIPPATATTQTIEQLPGNIFVAIWPVSLRVSAGAVKMPYQFNYQINNNNNSGSAPVTLHFVAPATTTLFQQVPGQSTSNTYFQSYYKCESGSGPQAAVPFNPNQNLSIVIPANPGGICNIYVAFTVTATTPPNPYTDNFTLAFDTPANFPSVITPMSYATGNPIMANGSPLTRTITFTNHCPYTVNYALHGATVQAKNQISVSCTTDADCFNGSSCYQSQCQWKQPVPTNGYALNQGDATSVVIPMYDNAIKLNITSTRDVTWGGNLAGRAGCSGSSCQVNDCGPASMSGGIGACTLGIGSASSPVSASEFTLQADDPLIYSNQPSVNLAVDNYNVQLIDGVTVPSTMTPTNGSLSSTDAFACAGAGLKTPLPNAAQTQKACLWDFGSRFSPPQGVSDYLWVNYGLGAATCVDDSDCTSPERCGLMVNPQGTVLTKACGLPVIAGATVGASPMYWTANAVCKVDPTYGAPFYCNSTNNPLYTCSGSLAVSCYGTSTTSCCGCTNWPTIAGIQSSEACGTSISQANPDWTSLVEDKITWIKEGCPTAYSYPYDDPSSSFTCLVNQPLTTPTDSYDGNVNTTNYAVEFCP